jgi:hypothetical protein
MITYQITTKTEETNALYPITFLAYIGVFLYFFYQFPLVVFAFLIIYILEPLIYILLMKKIFYYSSAFLIVCLLAVYLNAEYKALSNFNFYYILISSSVIFVLTIASIKYLK